MVYYHAWTFFFLPICGTFNLMSIYHGFFCLVYICVTIFVIYIYIYMFLFKTYFHIVMVINIKLVINYDILNNIPTQNRPNCTLYIASHM